MLDFYASEDVLRQYLDFHYLGSTPEYLPLHPLPEGVLGYPGRCAKLLVKHSTAFKSALDLGCAVGGSSFALAEHFETVCGMDYSESFIAAANSLAATGTFRVSENRYTLPSEVRKTLPKFFQGDACNLSKDLGPFDAVLMANLLCRLPDPGKCLEGLKTVTAKGSTIVITTPCSWDETYTPKEKWLWPALEGIGKHLGSWCTLKETSELPFVIRDHQRRAQFTVAQASVWQVL